MNTSKLPTDYLLKLLGGLLLSLLVWQGKTLCDRVGSLERNQVRIMVSLGIEPISWESMKNAGTQPIVAAQVTNQTNKMP